MNQESFKEILFESKLGLATITLNRPEKINALTSKMFAEIKEALDLIELDSTVRVIIFNGYGKGFSSGQDLNDPSLCLDNLAHTLESNYNCLIRRLARIKQPVISVVHGIVAGAGASLAMAADLTICSKSAVFIQSFIHIGLMPDAGSTWFLVNKVGLQKAMGLAMTGEKISGQQADDLGLVWKSYDDDVLFSEVNHLAKSLINLPTEALYQIKLAIRSATINNLDQQLDLERDAQDKLGLTDDFREGVAAFLGKRSARFS